MTTLTKENYHSELNTHFLKMYLTIVDSSEDMLKEFTELNKALDGAGIDKEEINYLFLSYPCEFEKVDFSLKSFSEYIGFLEVSLKSLERALDLEDKLFSSGYLVECHAKLLMETFLENNHQKWDEKFQSFSAFNNMIYFDGDMYLAYTYFLGYLKNNQGLIYKMLKLPEIKEYYAKYEKDSFDFMSYGKGLGLESRPYIYSTEHKNNFMDIFIDESVYSSLQESALKEIKENQDKSWYRPMLTNKLQYLESQLQYLNHKLTMCNMNQVTANWAVLIQKYISQTITFFSDSLSLGVNAKQLTYILNKLCSALFGPEDTNSIDFIMSVTGSTRETTSKYLRAKMSSEDTAYAKTVIGAVHLFEKMDLENKKIRDFIKGLLKDNYIEMDKIDKESGRLSDELRKLREKYQNY